MARILVLVCVSACGSATAGPSSSTAQPSSLDDLRAGRRFHLETTLDRGQPLTLGIRLVPDLLAFAPSIDADLSVELDASWPGRRLAIAPHFPLTRAFERGGDSWSALCDARGRAHAADAREILAYLGTWCEMRTSTHAVEELVALANARASGLADAVRVDLADFLADSGHASQAIAWLDERRVATPEALDALATSYAASEQPLDARTVLDYLGDHDRAATPATTCRRLQHAMTVTAPEYRQPLETRLLALAPGDATCGRIVAPARCRQELVAHQPATCNHLDLDTALAADLARCRTYLTVRPDAQPAVTLLALRGYWQPYFGDACPWERIGEVAARALTVPGAERFALVALGNAVVESDCSAGARASIAKRARAIAADKAHRGEHDAEIAELTAMTEATCRAFRR
jgi:hypothetical protein